MIDLLLSIAMTVLLYLNFRFFPKFHVDTAQAIVINYLICVVTGLLFNPDVLMIIGNAQTGKWLWAGVIQGLMFYSVFVLVGWCTQNLGMAVASLVSKISMMIPVAVSIFLLNDKLIPSLEKILGIILALGALVFISLKKEKLPRSTEHDSLKTFDWRAIVMTITVFLGSGMVDTFSNYANARVINPSQTAAFTISVFLFAFVFGSLHLFIKSIKNSSSINYQTILGGITLGVPNFFAYYFMLTALQKFNNDGSFIFPMANISVILASTLLGVGIFNERLSNANKVGVAMALLSIVLLSIA